MVRSRTSKNQSFASSSSHASSICAGVASEAAFSLRRAASAARRRVPQPVVVAAEHLCDLTPGKFALHNWRLSSIDNLSRPSGYALRYFESELAGQRKVDGQIELGWPLDRQVARLGAFQNPVDIPRRLAGDVGQVRPLH